MGVHLVGLLVLLVPLMKFLLVAHLVGLQLHLVVVVDFAVSKRLPSSWGWLSRCS